MATIHEISAESRTDGGKGASRRLRRAGHVPAIVYGAKQPAQSIQMLHKDVLMAAKNEWFFSSILDLNMEGSKQKVVLRDLQRHPFKPQVLHMDFLRISEDEEIRVRIPLHFTNQESSPAYKKSGVVISHNRTDVEVACLPRHLPEYIEVDLADLDEDDIIRLSALSLPEGVEILELRYGKDHDYTVVSAHAVREEVEEEIEPEAAEGEEAAAAVPASEQGDEDAGEEGGKAEARDEDKGQDKRKDKE